MRIVIADYSGHPFQVQLSRELARRGHIVLHLYFAEFQTPKGRLTVRADDPETLSIEPISLGKPFAKHSFIKRRFQEVDVGKLFAARIAEFKADVVVASNLPLDSLRIVAKRSQAASCAFVFWQQDIYSIAIDRIMRQRLGPIGALIGEYYKRIERAVLRKSQAIVVITEDFRPHLREEFQINEKYIHVIENWAPINEITPQSKDNPWARDHGLSDKDVVLYSGTLGMKHDPNLIVTVAQSLRGRANTEVLVISEGPAAAWLMQKSLELELPSLRVIGFQPFDVYSNVLATADILFSILEPSSGVYSVPSKVLSYLCAGRSIVLSAPLENLASRIVERSGVGRSVPAGDGTLLANVIGAMLDNPEERKKSGERGRDYAERTFDISLIGDRFEALILQAKEDMFAKLLVCAPVDQEPKYG